MESNSLLLPPASVYKVVFALGVLAATPVPICSGPNLEGILLPSRTQRYSNLAVVFTFLWFTVQSRAVQTVGLTCLSLPWSSLEQVS